MRSDFSLKIATKYTAAAAVVNKSLGTYRYDYYTSVVLSSQQE